MGKKGKVSKIWIGAVLAGILLAVLSVSLSFWMDKPSKSIVIKGPVGLELISRQGLVLKIDKKKISDTMEQLNLTLPLGNHVLVVQHGGGYSTFDLAIQVTRANAKKPQSYHFELSPRKHLQLKRPFPPS